MSAALLYPLKTRFVDANGSPLSGYKLYSYEAGTVTPLDTYTNFGAGTPNSNPVVLDSNGEAEIWIGTSAYKFVLTTAADVEVWTVDNVYSLPDSIVTSIKLQNGCVTTAKIADSNVTTAKIKDLAVTTEKLGSSAVTVAKIVDRNLEASASTGVLTIAATTETSFAGVSITTSGRPVMLFLESDGGGSAASLIYNAPASYDFFGLIFLYRNFVLIDVLLISALQTPSGFDVYVPPGSFRYLDDGAAAGENVYLMTITLSAAEVGQTFSIARCKLVAVEL